MIVSVFFTHNIITVLHVSALKKHHVSGARMLYHGGIVPEVGIKGRDKELHPITMAS